LTRLRALAFGFAALIFAANFVLVQWMLGIGVTGQTLIPGLVDFRPALNRGVSFSLLAQDGVIGRYLLIALLVIVVIVVAVMAWRAATPLASLGFGLILGGALGNLRDRFFLHGAVFDFLSVHLGTLMLFVCNFADIAISAGAVLFILDSVLVKQRSTSIQSPP
jgi:signal peptidase II